MSLCRRTKRNRLGVTNISEPSSEQCKPLGENLNAKFRKSALCMRLAMSLMEHVFVIAVVVVSRHVVLAISAEILVAAAIINV